MGNKDLWDRLNSNSAKTESVILGMNQANRTITGDEADIFAVRGDDAIDYMIRAAFQTIDLGLVKIDEIQKFKNYPFSADVPEEIADLEADILNNGLKTPVIIRPARNSEFEYEMIDGHRRADIFKKAGKTDIEAYIINCNDDMAALIMCENNLSARKGLLTSELARVYGIELEALKRLQRKNLKIDKPVNLKLSENTTRALVAQRHGLSAVNLSRMIRITFLNEELRQAVDEKRVAFNVGVALTHLSGEEQQIVRKLLDSGCRISLDDANRLKKRAKSQLTAMSEAEIREILDFREIHINEESGEKKAEGETDSVCGICGESEAAEYTGDKKDSKSVKNETGGKPRDIFMEVCGLAWDRLEESGNIPTDAQLGEDKREKIARKIAEMFVSL
ncbi:MAG: ParB N-terminal domain-containing protein [Firmicutes bacterium]|nr:ParB N-terminal domain-containing protein [Bacillota bacterium]